MLHLKIITPRKVVFEKDVSSITVPTAEGEISVLPHHTRLFSLLVEGVVKIKEEKSENYLAIGGGYLETDGSEINILVSRAYGQDEIDHNLTQEAIEKAKKLLKEAPNESQKQEAFLSLRRSMVDLKLLKRRRAKHTVLEN